MHTTTSALPLPAPTPAALPVAWVMLGTFIVTKLAIVAQAEGKSINTLAQEALQQRVEA